LQDHPTKIDIAEMMQFLMAKMGANTKTMQDDMKTNQAKTDINLKEMRKEIKSGQAEMRSIVNAWLRDLKINRNETMACQEMMEACLE
jgi:hypothetical protein